MQIVNSLGRYQLVPLVFSQSAVAASQTAAALYAQEVHGAVVLDNLGYTMPFAGQIVGITANLTAAATGGTLTVAPTIDTTAQTDPILSITTQTVKSDTAKRTTTPFAKEAVIGVKITTTGTWTAETMDLLVVVWVALKIAGI